MTLWTQQNYRLINTTKAKELVIGPWAQQNINLLSIQAGTIERVAHFKLLGVYIDSKLSWNKHIDDVDSKASKYLFVKSSKTLRLAL